MNPWLGLASYTEESANNNQYFYGRDNAVETVVRKIKNNLVVTLYGRSGIGKSSLLKAGVFPILKKDNYYPIEVRFSSKEGDVSMASFLWNTIISVLGNNGIIFVKYDNEFEPDYCDINVLRYLFSSGQFIRESDNATIIPVIVLDQFEETLYSNYQVSILFLQQLYALIDDNIDIKVAHPNWSDNTNFRIVISIREDDLFLLEDLIENYNLFDFKDNRYRLLPLTKDEARDIILIPAPDIFETNELDEIANEIISISSSGSGGQINTLMLSLLCYLLYEEYQSKNRQINLEDVRKHRDNLIESYYLETIKDIPNSERKYIEDSLVDEQGRRSYIYLSDLEANAPKAKEKFLNDDSNARLFNLNQNKVEFIHDQLAATVGKLGKNRRKRSLQKYTTWLLAFGLLCLLLCSLSIIRDISYKRVIEDDRIWCVSNNNKVEHLTIPKIADTCTFHTKYIFDCPNLKSITVKALSANLKVQNCPSLVKINIPKNFIGSIEAYNCPELENSDIIKVRDRSIYSVKANYKNQVGCPAVINFIDSTLNFNILPYSYDWESDKIGSAYFLQWDLDLNDSIQKKSITCYVPFGYKDHFVSLPDFMGFKEIKEKPIYDRWIFVFSQMTGWFGAHKISLISFVAGVCLLLLIFPKFSLFSILSWTSFYWFSFNVLVLSQRTSTIIAILATIIILIIVYKYWYTLFQYFKKGGRIKLKNDFRILLSRLKKRHKIIYVVASVAIVGVIVFVLLYNHHSNKIEEANLFKEIESLISNDQQVLAYKLIKTRYNELSSYSKQKADSIRRFLISDNSSIMVIDIDADRPINVNKKWICVRGDGMEQMINPFTNERINLKNIIGFKSEGILNSPESYFAYKDWSHLLALNLKTFAIDTISKSHVDAFAFSRDGSKLIYGNSERLIVKNLKDKDSTEYVNFPKVELKVMRHFNNENLIGAVDKEDCLTIFNLNTDEVVKTIKLPKSTDDFIVSAIDNDYILTSYGKINWKTNDVELFSSDSYIISNGKDDFLIEEFESKDDELGGFRVFKNYSKKGKVFRTYRIGGSYSCRVDPSSNYLYVTFGIHIYMYYIGDNSEDKFKPFVNNNPVNTSSK